VDVFTYAHTLLFGTTLADKLLPPSVVDRQATSSLKLPIDIPLAPGRPKNLIFAEKLPPFPKRTSFGRAESRATALHFFANHELLAIEMMALAILRFFPEGERGERFRRGLLKTIAEEQNHLSFYKQRMNELGLDFGDLPVNDFFWDRGRMSASPEVFYALIALTFEQANLDFAAYYRDLFSAAGDQVSADIMQKVLDDEIGHVAMGARWITSHTQDKELWEMYNQLLPAPLSPARGKGMHFNREARIKVGFTPDFIDKMENYREESRIGNRKEWN
jgi:uncharacterized ferritin-like protein (DUF455 family)